MQWDHGGANSYRMGAEGKYDLTLADEPQPTPPQTTPAQTTPPTTSGETSERGTPPPSQSTTSSRSVVVFMYVVLVHCARTCTISPLSSVHVSCEKLCKGGVCPHILSASGVSSLHPPPLQPSFPLSQNTCTLYSAPLHCVKYINTIFQTVIYTWFNCSVPLYRVVGIDSLLQALGAGEGDQSVAARQLRAEIQRLEQQDADLLDYDEQEEDEEEEMVKSLFPSNYLLLC